MTTTKVNKDELTQEQIDAQKKMDIIKDIPNFKERVLNVLEMYEFDLTTTKKKERYFTKVMLEIVRFINRNYYDEVPLEDGDLLDWAIGYMNFENLANDWPPKSHEFHQFLRFQPLM